MKIDPKLKGGLAWAGLFVILAVPSADILFGGQSDASATTVTSDTRAVTANPAAPALTLDPIETASTGAKDPVDVLLDKGKTLPSYISYGDVAAVPKPVKTTPLGPAATVEDGTDMASVDPAATAPVPLPRSARPKWTEVATVPAEPAAPVEQPLILDEDQVAAADPVEPFPLSDDGTEIVTSDELEEWDSGSLADYLARKGLLSEGSQSNQAYDQDGFFLDDGPNSTQRAPRAEDEGFFLF